MTVIRSVFIVFLAIAAINLAGCRTGAEVKTEIELGLIPLPASMEITSHNMNNSDSIEIQEILINESAQPPEGYTLRIKDGRAVITAGTAAGVFYGRQTLKQLQLLNRHIPDLMITDYPRVAYRGMMLDVSRHFQSVENVKKFIDYMALYKYNKLQWHLSDDQGWRVEIKSYPRLTQIGSVRGSAEKPYGPFFYTQEQIRNIVQYAAERNITIIPEIDIPGHSISALAAYPELGCTGGPYEVWNKIGISNDILCAGNPATMEYLEGVYGEIAELFPGELVHIGGDEAPLERWGACPKCQVAMQELNYSSPRELQRHFTGNVAGILQRHGKRMVGWDELLHSGVPENGVVMSWRGNSGALRAGGRNLNSIITSYSHLYFDYAQGKTHQERNSAGSLITRRRAYSFDPTLGNQELTDKYLLGAQANLWAESIYDMDWLEHKAMPRMQALAEAVWSPQELRNYESFEQRLMHHFKWLDAMGASPRYAPFELPEQIFFAGEYTVDYGPLPEGMEIVYTMNGKDPDTADDFFRYSRQRPKFYSGGKLCMRLLLPSMRRSIMTETEFIQMAPDAEQLRPGLMFELRNGVFENLDQAVAAPADVLFIDDKFDFMRPEFSTENGFGLTASGYFSAPESGSYEFSVAAMWGARIYLDGILLINANPAGGTYYSTEKSIYLPKGYHPIKVEYFSRDFGQLQLYVALNSQMQMPLAEGYLFHEAGR